MYHDIFPSLPPKNNNKRAGGVGEENKCTQYSKNYYEMIHNKKTTGSMEGKKGKKMYCISWLCVTFSATETFDSLYSTKETNWRSAPPKYWIPSIGQKRKKGKTTRLYQKFFSPWQHDGRAKGGGIPKTRFPLPPQTPKFRQEENKH